MELLEERLRLKRKQERQREATRRAFDIPDMRAFLMEQKSFLETTVNELVEVDE